MTEDARLLHGLSLIGASRGAPGPQTFAAEDPATGETLEPLFHRATREDVDAACRLAASAAPLLGQVDASARAAFLRDAAARLEAAKDAVVARARRESGLPEARLK